MKVFLALGSFLLVIGAVYWFITYEDAGSVLLVGSALMAAIVGGYLARAGIGAEPAASDRRDGDPRDLAGTSVGSFPFSSVWPVVFALGSLLVGMGLIYALILLPVGVVVTAIAVLGLMRESRS